MLGLEVSSPLQLSWGSRSAACLLTGNAECCTCRAVARHSLHAGCNVGCQLPPAIALHISFRIAFAAYLPTCKAHGLDCLHAMQACMTG
jgi:hypothetical protein